MFKVILYFLLSLVSLSAHAEAGSVMQSGKMIGIYQTVGLPGDGYENALVAKVGKVKFSKEDGHSLAQNSRTIDLKGRIGAIPYVTFDEAEPYTQSQFIQRASDFQSNIHQARFVEDVQSLLREHGASELVYSYRQRIKVAGNPTTKALLWRVIYDMNGRPRYSAPKVVSDIPTFVYLQYVPLRVADGLPASFAYNLAGTYTYQLVNKNMQALTSPITVNVAGSFDAPSIAGASGCQVGIDNPDSPDDESSTFCDPDHGLKCLISSVSNPGCQTTYKDVLALMDELGADGGFVDYNREIAPVYEAYCPTGAVYNSSDATCSDGSDPEERAQAAIDVPLRKLSSSACLPDASYENRINVGYTLNKQVDRFFVQTDGYYMPHGSQAQQEASPTVQYNPIIALRPVPSNISQYMIEPLGLALANVNEFENIINLAPVITEYTGEPNRSWTDAYRNRDHWGFGAQEVRVDVRCTGGRIYVSYYGANHAYWMGPTKDATFNMGTASNDYSQMWYAVKRQMMDQSTTWCYNGYDRITMCGSPKFDGYNPEEGTSAVPPPRQLAHCNQGEMLQHRHIDQTTTQQCSGSICFGGQIVPQQSDLYCTTPPVSYGGCAPTVTVRVTSGSWNLPQTYRYVRETESTCVYTNNYIVNKAYSCAAGYGQLPGFGCVRDPEYYIDLR